MTNQIESYVVNYYNTKTRNYEKRVQVKNVHGFTEYRTYEQHESDRIMQRLKDMAVKLNKKLAVA